MLRIYSFGDHERLRCYLSRFGYCFNKKLEVYSYNYVRLAKTDEIQIISLTENITLKKVEYLKFYFIVHVLKFYSRKFCILQKYDF